MNIQWRFMACLCAALCLTRSFCMADGGPAADGILAALRATVSQHPAVKSKLYELKALGYDLEAAQSQRYPTFSVQATTSSNVVTSSALDQYGVVAIAQQPIWVGGRIDGSINQAGVKLRIGELALLALRRQLMESAASAYSAALGGGKRLEAAQLNVLEHEKLKQLITRREAGGIASRADVLLASSRLSQALAQRIQLEGVLKRSLFELLAYTQQPVAVRPVPGAGDALPAPDRALDAIEKNSATVRQRLLEVDLAKVADDLVFANLMPSVYAKAEQDLYSATQHGSAPLGTRFGVVVQGNVEGFGISGWKRLKSSGSRNEAAKRDVDTARNEVRRQAQALLTDLESLRLVRDSNELLVKSTQETLTSFLRQYDAGRKSWVDVLNTQRELSDARLTLEQTRSSLLETQLRLAIELGQYDHAMGVLL